MSDESKCNNYYNNYERYSMKTQWTKEQACEWYSRLGWLRGCNFIGSDCANRIDMWQSYGSEARLENADRELGLCEKIGFNTVRYLVEFDVWYQERESFMNILEQYIALAAKHGQSVMICLANEAQLPRGDKYVPKPLGEHDGLDLASANPLPHCSDADAPLFSEFGRGKIAVHLPIFIHLECLHFLFNTSSNPDRLEYKYSHPVPMHIHWH